VKGLVGNFAATVVVTLALVAAGLAVYDREVVRPASRVGVVDLAEVYRGKEREFTELVTRAGSGEAERARAMAMASSFAERLPEALDGLAEECGCLVLLRSAVAARTPNMVDLTPRLKARLEGR